MKNAIVYSFNLMNGKLEDLICYKQLRYSIKTLRDFNKDIPVYIHISPTSLKIDKCNLGFDSNVNVIKFDVEDDGEWPIDWSEGVFLKCLKHRWENAIKSIHTYNLDNILYLDTDTVFHADPEILFKKYGSTKYLWAKPDNSYGLMSRINVKDGINDGQFILSKEIANKDILTHMKYYVNFILSKYKKYFNDKDYATLSWVCTQYSVSDYFQNNNNPAKYFDENEVMLHHEPNQKDITNLVLHHYYSSNSKEFLPEEYL